MTIKPDVTPDLWQRAIDSLSPSITKSLESAKTGKRDVALAALKAAEEKRQLTLKKRWRIKKSSGEDEIIVRDVVEKIIHWIRRFRDVGNQIIQYDPGHAALPWAAFRFLLQIAINDTTIYGGMVDDLEMVARLMARFREIERMYLTGPAAVDDQLCNALVKVYAKILEFLAKAVKFFGDSTATRLLKAPFRSVDEDGKEEILSRESEVLKLAALVDAERLANIETQVLRLADLSIASQKAVQEQEYLDVLRWLSQVPYSRHHEFHRETRVAGTGQWLIQHPYVRSWTSASSCSMLLLHGIPGCGKTALCSAIIDMYLDNMAKCPSLAPLGYFYCNASESEPERRTPEGVLRSLARQLTVSNAPQPTIHSAVLALHSKFLDDTTTDGFEIRKPNISDCVELIFAALDDNPATLIIDGLDEIDEPKRLVDALHAITGRSKNVVNVFITSRDSPAIFAMLPSIQTIRITDDKNKADIRLFATNAVTGAISDHKLLNGNVPQTLKEQLVEALVSGAGEMFLWVKLQLLHFCSIEHEKDLIAASTGLAASKLNELYQAAYERIQQAGKVAQEIAIRSFSWLLYAREPLTVDVFRLAIVSGTSLEQPTIENILLICRGFLYLDRQSMILRLAHHSVREFFQLQSTLAPGHAQNLLAASCLSICNDPLDVDITTIKPTERAYDYAVLYCGDHCSAAQTYGESSTVTQELTTFLFDGDEPSLSARIWMDNCRVAYKSLPREHPQKTAMELVSNELCSPLFPVCTFGFSDVLTNTTWPANVDWNERNDYGHTALYAASFFGHTKVVAFLLDQRADRNVECGRLGSALHCAAYRGHIDIVKLLLDHGADVRLGGKFDTAVHAACRGDQEDVVLAILNETEMTDQMQYDAALEVVSEAGFSQAMKKLQGHPLSHTTRVSKKLHMANKVIISGKVANLKYLTRQSTLADVVPPGSVALSALHGHEAMTTYLLDHGLDIAEVGDLGTPLRCASLNGNSSVCHLLLNRGADVNGNARFGSALHAAAMKGQLHIVKLVLDAGASVNIQGGYYGTPLQAAAYQGHKEVVSLLVAAGADPQQSGFSKDAFHAAAEGGRHEIVQLLLSSGFTLLEPIQYGRMNASMAPPPPRNLLREASPGGRESMRGWRCRYGWRSRFDDQSSDSEDEIARDWVDLSNPTPRVRAYVPRGRQSCDDEAEQHNYPLEAAAALGHFEVICEILAQREFLGLDNSSIDKALIAACKHGHQEVAEKILSRMEESDIPLREALQEAASNAHVPVVRMLLARDLAAENQSDLLKATLLSSIDGHEQAFHEILLTAEKLLSETQIKEILLELLEAAAGADRSDIVQVVMTCNEAVDEKKIISALMDTCKGGKLAAAKMLYETLPPLTLSRVEFSKCIRLAVENGHIGIVRYLFPSFSTRGRPKYLRHMILVAAGCGHLDILDLILTDIKANDPELLQQALNVAAENGHEKTCAYLLSRGFGPCKPAATITWGDVSIDRGRNRLSWMDDQENLSSDSESEIDATEPNAKAKEQVNMAADPNDGNTDERTNDIVPIQDTADIDGVGVENPKLPTDQVRSDKGESNRAVDLPLLAAGGRAFNAIESCLSGFKQLEDRDEMFFTMRDSWWQAGNTKARASTLRLLLESVPSFKDQMWDEAICAAAKLCPPPLVEFMLVKGVNASAQHGDKSALDFAVRRERLCFPVVQALVQERADADIAVHELKALFAQAASFFLEHTGRPYDQGALFTQTKSLEDVFTTGPGAVLKYVLQRLQGEDLSGVHYSVPLQCAAATGGTEIVTLLLEHGAKVNRAGSYYGTALQAASRFGHADIVKLLLDAGADPNIRQGRHHTALRAAVMGESLEIVHLLLQASANTELSANWSYRDEEEDDPTALQLAVQHKHSEIARALIAAGADINVKRTHQQPLLIQACKSGDLTLICALLEAGTDVQTHGHKHPHHASMLREDGSAVHAAIEAGLLDVIELLLSKGFRLSADAADRDAPLPFAASKGDVEIIDTLLQSEPSMTDETMVQSLKQAIRSSHFTAAERLLYHRPNVLDDGNGISILRDACDKGDTDIIELLLEELSFRGEVQSACTAVLHDPPEGTAAVFEMVLEYVPCTVDLFVEACARGYEGIVKTGLEQRIPVNAIDSKGRPALQFAASQGSTAVLELLLTFGADPNAQDITYGTPLVAALEGCVVKGLTSKQLPEDVQTHTHLLTGKPPSHEFIIFGLERQRTNNLSYQKAQQFEKIVQLLLEKSASPNPRKGPFGSILTMAAFTGINNIFNILLRNGAINAVGGYLHSPLIAAINGVHMDMAREILGLTSDTSGIGGERESALHRACEKSNLPAVKLLLHHGVDIQKKNDNGDTPLRVSLAKLAKINDNFRSTSSTAERPHEDVIANLLLDADTTTVMTDEDFIAAAEIKSEDSRTRILQKMIPRAESAYFPEDAYISLIKHSRYSYGSSKTLVQQLLDEKRIQRITTRILAAVENVETMTTLLDYDPTYTITPETLDSVGGSTGIYNRDMTSLLLERDESVVPLESNVLTVLKQSYINSHIRRSADKNKPHVLEVMFSRNPQLKITEDMFIAVLHPEDLEILLPRTSVEEGLVTHAVMAAIAKKYGNYKEVLKMFLQFDQAAVIPPETADHQIHLDGLDGLELLWNHDPNLQISEGPLLSLVHHVHRTSWTKRADPPGDFIKLLREHPGQWTSTRKVRDAIDHKFQEDSDRDLKELYYSVFDGGEAGS